MTPASLAPENMTAEVQKACEESGQQIPQGIAEVAAVIYNSLAVCYAKTLKELEEQTGCRYRTIHVVGGGANADYLNRLTAEKTGRTVLAGGNCYRQSGGADDHRKGMQQFEGCEKVYFPFLRNQTI